MDQTRNELETLRRQVADKLARRICLNHGEVIDESEAVRRGLCQSCYQEAHRAITAGLFGWRDLEEKGLAAPATKGGRPKKRPGKTPLTKLIEAAESKAMDVAHGNRDRKGQGARK